MIKLTKNELRSEQSRLQLLYKYLPTLQLKKAMLQAEVNEARLEIINLKTEFEALHKAVEAFSLILSTPLIFDLQKSIKPKEVKKRYENIAGVEVPYFEEVIFEPFEYRLIDTPPWVESARDKMQNLMIAREKIRVAEEKKKALEGELREVSIRVNLFEKVLIPRALENIKKIKVFLGDQLLAAVSRAKVAKAKMAGR